MKSFEEVQKEQREREIERNFTYYASKTDQIERYRDIRDHAKKFALLINDYCPNSREKSLSLTKIEEAVMWANAAIARNEN